MKTTLVVVGAAVFLVATVYALAHSGSRYGTIDPGGATKSKPGKPVMPLQKPPKPKKKYKVNSDVEKWQEQKKLLYYQIV